MSVLQRVSLLANERFDSPDARAIEAFSLNDWRYFMSGFFSTKSYILQGFEIANYTTVFSVPGFSIITNDAIFFHSEATTQAAGFYVAAGTEASANITLAPGSINFVEADLQVQSAVPDVRAFWDSSANSGAGQEYTEVVQTVVNLGILVSSNITSFTTGKLPLYKIVTNSSNVITSITDCRNLFFRLGSGGNVPDPSNNYLWPSLPDSSHSRFETPNTAIAATASNAPFQGGDKNILNWKQWMDAVMSSIKEVKGTQFWYQPGSSGGGGGVPTAYQNAALTIMVGGTWEHLPAPSPAGHLALLGGSTCFRLGFNNSLSFAAFADLSLVSYRVLWVLLPASDTAVTYRFGDDGTSPVIPKTLSAVTSTSVSVATGGNFITTGGSILIRGIAFSYTSYTAGTGLFSGISPDPSGLAQVGDSVYQNDSAGFGYYHYSSSANVPGVVGSVSEGAERVMWLALFDGVSVIQLHNGDLQIGEEINVGDNTSLNLLAYVGSPSDASSTPSFATQAVGSLNSTTSYNSVNGENLTVRLSKITSMMADKAQDRNLRFFRDAIGDITNATSGSYQNITFGGTTPVLYIAIPGSPYNMSIGLGGTLALAVNQAAYVTINRNASSNVTDLSGLTIVNLSAMPISENTILVAARLSDALIYLWDGTRINIGAYASDQVLSTALRTHLGVTGEDSHEAITSTHNIADADTYPAMLSNLDAAIYGIQSANAKEENFIVTSSLTSYTATTLAWSADNTLVDIQVYINGKKITQDTTGGLNQDYYKASSTQLNFSFTIPVNARITIRNERTGGGGNWGVPINAHLIPSIDDTYDLGSPTLRFRDLYVAGKATIVGGIDPAYLQLTPQSDTSSIPTNSLFVDANDSNQLKVMQTGGSIATIGTSAPVTATNYLVKIMQNNGATSIAAGMPVSKTSDGSIIAAQSNAVGGQAFIGIAAATILGSGGLGAVLLAGPSGEGVLTGLGFTPGDTVYVSQSSGVYTNNDTSFPSGSSYIQVGVADCAAGVASSTVTDLIMMPQILLRP